VTQIAQQSNSNLKTYTNELRLVSTPGTALSWAAGFDYRHTDASGPTTTKTAPNQLPFELLGASGDTVDKIWALWAEGGYKFADRLTATVGARYYHDETTATTSSTLFGVPSTANEQATFTSTNPRVNLSYQLAKDQLIYVEAAKGFRSGGFNTSPYPPYDPESLWTYELGSKGEYLDRKLSLEADVYYNDWKGVQDTFTLPNGLAVIENGGHVTGPGFDLAAIWTPIKNFEIGATYGWNNLKFTAVPPNGDKIVGDRPDFSVRNTWSAFTDYRHRIATGLDAYGRVDFNHKGQSQITFREPPYNQVIVLPTQELLNVRLGLTFRNYDASVYVNNATNERAPIIPGPFGIITENVELRPRVYGVTVMAHF
jgi:outer membrane receptor protein involved in Fe transport